MWACEAYGDEGVELGAWCFFADQRERDCASTEVCHTRMVAERKRVYRLINAMAATGDEDMAALADAAATPEQLLGGGEGMLWING